MFCRRKQYLKHGPEHSFCFGGCCGAFREAPLRQSVWAVVHEEPRPRLSPVRPLVAQGTSACFSSRGSSRPKGPAKEPVRAVFGFWPKKAFETPTRGSNPGKLTLILILVPTRFLFHFHARSRFERRNPRLERRCLDPFVTGVPP